jgi:hypothetical protein
LIPTSRDSTLELPGTICGSGRTPLL